MAKADATPGKGHNSGPRNGDEDPNLKLFFERIGRLDEERQGIADDIKDVFAEAKASGYDTKAMRRAYRLWKMVPSDRVAQMAVDEAYNRALGLDLV
jgi:uncharacterized protein (UPF0335 family)